MTGLTVPDNVSKYDKVYQGGYDKKYPNLDLVRLEGWYFKKQPGRVLDYGAGTGVNAFHLAECGYDATAVDASKESVKLMEEKYGDRLTVGWVDPNVDRLPFDDDSFDYVVCMSVMSLLETKDRIETLVKEFHRILKPGGKMIADINGPESDFAARGRFIDEDTFEYVLHGDEEKALRCYCPRTKEVFGELFGDFVIDDLGYVAFQYQGNDSYEFVACVHKPE